MRFNFWQVQGVGKSAEVIQHHKVPATNHFKLHFEFAEHFLHLFWAPAATPAGLTAEALRWVDLLRAKLASSCHLSPHRGLSQDEQNDIKTSLPR